MEDMRGRTGTEYQKLRSFMLLLERPEDPKTRTLAELVDRTLSPKQKNVVRMYYIGQMPMHRIAGQLGVNASTVCRTLKCAREKLNLCIDLLGAGAALRR